MTEQIPVMPADVFESMPGMYRRIAEFLQDAGKIQIEKPPKPPGGP